MKAGLRKAKREKLKLSQSNALNSVNESQSQAPGTEQNYEIIQKNLSSTNSDIIEINKNINTNLEKEDIIYGEDLKDNNVNEKNKKLIKLIEKICKENNYDDKIKSITLYQAIYKLSKRLKIIYEKVYEPSIKIISGDFIDFNKDKISKINREKKG